MSTNEITAESPYDIVTVFEVPNGATMRPVPLYRKHRDEIDAYRNDRSIPSSFVYAILTDGLLQTIASAESFRELEGLTGAARYLINSTPEHLYGTRERVTDHLRAGA